MFSIMKTVIAIVESAGVTCVDLARFSDGAFRNHPATKSIRTKAKSPYRAQTHSRREMRCSRAIKAVANN